MELYPKSDTQAGKPEQEDPDEKTFLIPKGAFGDGCKPGDIYKIRVVSVLEDELEVEPAGEDKKEEKSEKSKPEDDMENPVDQYMT